MLQAGVKDFEAGTWFGLLGPAGLPPAILSQLSAATNDFLKERDVRETLTSQGALIKGGSPAEFRQFFQSEYDKWGRIVRSAGVKAD
jgi:tripartite-type tricarboxylate transporter receptor subunit TctC